MRKAWPCGSHQGMLVSTSVQKRKAGAMAETKRYDELETVQIPEQEVRPEGSDTSTLPEEREEGITKPFDTKSIRIESKSGNMNTLLDRLQNDEIDLQPDFQRQAGIWNEENQSRLMESFMLRIPVPAFYFDGPSSGGIGYPVLRQMALEPPHGPEVAAHMGQESDDPGERVGPVDGLRRVELRKHRHGTCSDCL